MSGQILLLGGAVWAAALGALAWALARSAQRGEEEQSRLIEEWEERRRTMARREMDKAA